jgi:hypothetical protein
MAATKTRAKDTKPKARGSTKPKKTRTPAKAKKRATTKPKSRTTKPKTAASKPAPSKPQAALETVEETVKDAGGSVKDAGGTVGRAVGKAKVPLMAGGAALAGAAGGLALGSRQAHRKNGLGGLGSKDLAKAARKAGDIGAQVGEIALEVRRARESSNGNGKVHRSPIEVVLQGLTSRGPRG